MLSNKDVINYFTYLCKKEEEKLSVEEKKSIDKYFSLSYSIEIQNEYESYYYRQENNKVLDINFVLSLNETKVLHVNYQFDGVDIKNSYDYNKSNLDSKYANTVFCHLFFKLLDGDKKFCDSLLPGVNQINEMKKSRWKEEFIESIDSASKDADELDAINDQEKVLVHPILKLGNRLNLSIKIGRNKLYSTGPLHSFLDKIHEKRKHKYGKELEFVHDFSSFDEKGEKLLRLLDEQKTYYYQEADLNRELFSKIMEIYDKDEIEVVSGGKSENYLIDNQYAGSIKFHIDKNYLLSISVPIKDRLDFLYYSYIVDYTNMRILSYCKDPVLRKLIAVIINSPYPCLEDNIDDFKYSFILRYPDKFEIDNEVKDEFELNLLDIKAYFDLENNEISLVEKTFLEDKPVKIDELNSKLKGQYNKYRSIINSLGFIDNVLKDETKIISFLSSSLDSLKQYCEIYLSDNILNKSISKFNPPNIRVNYESSMLSVFLEESRYSDEELYALINALRKKKKFILYKDQIITLNDEEADRFLDNIEEFHLLDKQNLKKEEKLPIYYAFKALDNASGLSLNEQIFAIFNEIKNYKNNSFAGGKIIGELRKYQSAGIKWLDILYRHYLNGILADDMGLGKTIEIISFLKGENIKDNVLIVAPKSLVFNWHNEFAKFAPDMKVISIYGGQKDRENIIKKITPNKGIIYLTSYDSLRRDEELYSDKEFDTIILDEAQYIKNSKAKKTISVGKIKSQHRFVLTGTPIENSVLDLWSIFNFLMPNYLPSENEFKSKFEGDENYAHKIKQYVAPFILRRTKKDVLTDLPEKYETILTCEMNEAQRKIYDAHILLAKENLANGGGAFDVLPYLTRLRQICIDPSLFVSDYKGGSGKIEELERLIEDKLGDGHRLLIFSQFVSALEIIQDKLKEKEIRYEIITGKTSAEERIRIANDFNSTKKIKICLVSLKAGGTGLNLVGADVVIHLDPWWNVAAQDQASDRAHRIGQSRNVEVIKMICEDSIEQRVVELQNYKKDLVDKIIAKDDSIITSLSLEDIKFILDRR